MKSVYLVDTCYRGDRISATSAALGLLLMGVFVLVGCRSMQSGVGHGADEETLPPVPREFRAAWIATVANIDWPSEPGLPVAEQKTELRQMLDQAAALNLNAVIFQVRPHADALYASEHEPWSFYLTGAQGEPPQPSYDPLAFAVSEAHERGLELHAWFNPFRAGHPADTSEVAPNHISRTDSDLVVTFGDYLWLDPGQPEARAHSRRVIIDVVERYDIDGVHFDDYFYPYPSYADSIDFPDSTSWQRAQQEGVTLSRDDWRRENINRFIEELYREIKQVKPHVKFGISPFGIWRPGHPAGTTGFDAYEALYADARLWLREGWVDYFTPQLYYAMDQTEQPYPIMLRWWTEQNAHDRHLWPGNFTSRVREEGERHWSDRELIGQLYTTRAQPDATGNVHFSMQALMPVPDSLLDLTMPDSLLANDSLAVDSLHADSVATAKPPVHLEDVQRLVERLETETYADPALIPPSPWLGDDPPGRPIVALREQPRRLRITMAPAEDDETVRWWVVRWREGAEWSFDVVSGGQQAYVLKRTSEAGWPDAISISAVDRLGNEGPAVVLDRWTARAGETSPVQ